jgi:hypothetical protein
MRRMGRASHRCGGKPIQPVASLRNEFFIRVIRVICGFPLGIRVKAARLHYGMMNLDAAVRMNREPREPRENQGTKSKWTAAKQFTHAVKQELFRNLFRFA